MAELRQNPFMAALGGLKDKIQGEKHAAAVEKTHAEEDSKAREAWMARRDADRGPAMAEAEARLASEVSLDERFCSALKGNFNQFPTKMIESYLPGIKQFGAVPSADGSELVIKLSYEKPRPVTKEFPGYVTLRLSEDGTLSGEIPADLKAAGLTPDLIRDEVIRTAEVLRIGFWIYKSVGETPGIGDPRALTGEGGGERLITREEMERLAFLHSLEGAVFGAVIESTRGFDGYNAIFLRNGTAVLDMQQVGNAVYIIPGLPAIEKLALSEKEKNFYFDENVLPVISSGKREARARGAIRVTHQAENWRESILAAL